MKISIGSNIIDGPWGGGNQFAMSLTNHLRNKGWSVVDDLEDTDIDIIIMTEPRKNLTSCKYNQKDIAKYLIRKPDTLVVHRINECDERKGTKNVNTYLARANKVADHTVFISEFLQGLFIEGKILDTENHSVIKNGADKTIFTHEGRKRWSRDEKIKLVTHHWGGNYYKGFDIYEVIDDLVDGKIEDKEIDFTYIGNLPEGFSFKHSRFISPLKGLELADKIKENHIYVTASINEPAGMHHIEGAMCGLPLLYRNSGGIPEYAKGFGVSFDDPSDFRQGLLEIIKDYDKYYELMPNYPYNSKLMCNEYERLLLKLIEEVKNFDLAERKKKFRNIFIREKFFSRSYRGDG